MRKEKRKEYACDFETTTQVPVRVWAWGAYEVQTGAYQWGNDIQSFLEDFCRTGQTYYFHNLKFDGEFLVYYMLSQGYEVKSLDRSDKLTRKSFKPMIDDTGAWYSLEVKNAKGRRFQIKDSLKFVLGSIESIAKQYGTTYEKGEIDYKKARPAGYEPTPEEQCYLYKDCSILGEAIKAIRAEGLLKDTSASNALNGYKDENPKRFKKCFPELSLTEDKFIRQSYRGGFTYLKPDRAMEEIGEGLALDVTSLYPSVMYNDLLPIGQGTYYEGKPPAEYPLYVQHIQCSFKLKPNHLPTLQIKGDPRFRATEYLENSKGFYVDLTLTSVDLELFLKHYDTEDLVYIDGYAYNGAKGLFKDYIDKWTQKKIEGKREGNAGQYQASKLMLNSLYGKFGAKPEGANRYPFMDHDGNVVYQESDAEDRTPVYIPLATFVTSYARLKTISTAQACYDRFIYSDTDSIHLIGSDLPDIEIHPTKLGAWDLEARFSRALFMKSKRYIYQTKEGIVRTCAGLPDDMQAKLNFDNFKKGLVLHGKLQQHRVKGGALLVEVNFTL